MVYRIMQIVHGGKVLRLANLSVIRGKTFVIVQQFKTPYSKKDKNLLENLRDWRLICENRESFLPRMICIIRYNVYHVLGGGSELPMHYPQWKRISVDVPLVNTLLSSLLKLTDGMLDGRLHNLSM